MTNILTKNLLMHVARLCLTGIALLLFHVTFSQAICGFDIIHKQLVQENTDYRSHLQRFESNLRSTIQQLNKQKKNKIGTLSGPPYNIPVVVHVITTGGAIGTIYNPTDAQIQGAIDYLNQVYSGSYPGMAGVGDLGLQFTLAKRDPNCNSSSGIERIDGSGVTDYSNYGVSISGGPGTNEINIKNLSRWNTSQYYNIWLVNKIDDNDGTSGTFIAGYAYFPGSPSSLDGTVMLATQMIAGQKTLPHEIGHAFSLYHPFEGSSDKTTCPQNTDCSIDGDQVCDTDPISYNQLGGNIDFSCRTGINSCTGTSYNTNTESNFMNYTNCYNVFTAGQRDRMQASAISPERITLTNSSGVLDPSASPSCGPKINFEMDGDNITESSGSTSGCRRLR
jgi:pregnancy-associated plasma protein-A